MTKKIIVAVIAIIVIAGGGWWLTHHESAGDKPTGGRGDKGDGAQMAFTDKSSDEQLQALISETVDKFTQGTFTDPESGVEITYNIYLPDNYMTSSKQYPLVAFIADSSLAGKEATESLTQGYGGIIWAGERDQALHEAIVLVPTYPEVILDDHNGYSTTAYVEATKNLLDEIVKSYNVDQGRIYATGQSMGCMTWLILASRYPDYFAANLYVSGQWDVSTLDPLGEQTFFYVSSAGDPGASVGMKNLEDEFDKLGVVYAHAEDWDAQWSQAEFQDAFDNLMTADDSRNFVSLLAGSTLPEGAAEGASEHMTSFDYVYKIDAIRDWLFQQVKQ